MLLNDMYYHGIRDQIRRVLNLLGDERIDKGLTAFETGSSTWSHCFFARALAPEVLHNEDDVCRILDLKSQDGNWNRIPVRIVYMTFDNRRKKPGFQMTHEQLKKFIEDVRYEKHTEAVNKFLATLDFSGVEDTPVEMCG